MWTSNGAFIFFTFPLIALVFDSFLTTRTIFWILIIAIALELPAVAGYWYTFPGVNRFLELVAISGVFSLLFDDQASLSSKKQVAVILSGILFVGLGLWALLDGFAGSQTVEKKWDTPKYRVEYVRDQGFAGGPKMTYELSRFGAVPVLIKRIETQLDDDTTGNCAVHFSKSKVIFDKCKGRISETSQ